METVISLLIHPGIGGSPVIKVCAYNEGKKAIHKGSNSVNAYKKDSTPPVIKVANSYGHLSTLSN